MKRNVQHLSKLMKTFLFLSVNQGEMKRNDILPKLYQMSCLIPFLVITLSVIKAAFIMQKSAR